MPICNHLAWAPVIVQDVNNPQSTKEDWRVRRTREIQGRMEDADPKVIVVVISTPQAELNRWFNRLPV